VYNEDVHDPAPVRRCWLLFDLLFTLPGAPITGLWLYYRIAGGIDEKVVCAARNFFVITAVI